MEEKVFLRRMMRQRRRALSQTEQQLASFSLTKQIKQSGLLRRFKRVALYWTTDNEISLLPLLKYLSKHHRKIYLPILLGKKMYFMRYKIGQPLKKNRFNIPEPNGRFQPIYPTVLDSVLMPLVAFDQQGNRLGMGGGFYDRYFEYLHYRRNKKPILWGVAYEWQRVEHLNTQWWDIPLQGVITDKGIYRFYEYRN
ncbi:MAG: hypothetical protein RIT27_2061 [Pseudomonadota bacterium]|jgi:5-formyltetrahydrofolate cyclo-ligase